MSEKLDLRWYERLTEIGATFGAGVVTALIARIRELESASQAVGGEVMEMALCEQQYLILKPGKLYLFHAIEGCELCAAMSREQGDKNGNS